MEVDWRLWESVYAKGTIAHMLSGHAFSRAIRAHILTLAAVVTVLTDTLSTLDDVDTDDLKNTYKHIFNQVRGAGGVFADGTLNNYVKTISQALSQAADQSRTGKLWVQYTKQVSLLQNFIRAERTGDSGLNLHCVREMIPYFHAAGHLHYAKASRLYLQNMEELGEKMSDREYKLMTEKGFSQYVELMPFGVETFLTRQSNNTLCEC